MLYAGRKSKLQPFILSSFQGQLHKSKGLFLGLPHSRVFQVTSQQPFAPLDSLVSSWMMLLCYRSASISAQGQL